MRFRSEMDVRVLKMMEGCCGPRDGHEWGEGRQWICSYHDGYNDGLNDCLDPS
jgi:hypothetical protein